MTVDVGLCRHVNEIALASLWMIRSGHARAVAHITAALVDSGGLALACQVKNGMVVLGEALAGCPCYELVRCVPQPCKETHRLHVGSFFAQAMASVMHCGAQRAG